MGEPQLNKVNELDPRLLLLSLVLLAGFGSQISAIILRVSELPKQVRMSSMSDCDEEKPVEHKQVDTHHASHFATSTSLSQSASSNAVLQIQLLFFNLKSGLHHHQTTLLSCPSCLSCPIVLVN